MTTRTQEVAHDKFFWQAVRAQGLQIPCVTHEFLNCATCAGLDNEGAMLPGARVTPRILPPGITVGEAHIAGSWDQHTPFRYCRNPLCCDPIDTLRRQS